MLADSGLMTASAATHQHSQLVGVNDLLHLVVETRDRAALGLASLDVLISHNWE